MNRHKSITYKILNRQQEFGVQLKDREYQPPVLITNLLDNYWLNYQLGLNLVRTLLQTPTKSIDPTNQSTSDRVQPAQTTQTTQPYGGLKQDSR